MRADFFAGGERWGASRTLSAFGSAYFFSVIKKTEKTLEPMAIAKIPSTLAAT
jgi:hypothetical protein